MNRKKDKSILRQARVAGYCIAHIIIALNVLSLEYVDTYEQETQEKFFQFIKQFLPEITWEEYWDSVNGSMKGFTVAQQMLPKLTWEMYKEISELKKEGSSAFTYVENHLETFKDSPLWERANEQFDDRKFNVQDALKYLADADADNAEYAEDSGAEDAEGLIPVLLWRDSSCDENKTWGRGTFDERHALAKKYMELPNLDIKEARDALKNAEPGQETVVRCGNGVAVGCQENGYNCFYIGMANPKRPWIIKYYADSWWEFIGYIKINECGYVTM